MSWIKKPDVASAEYIIGTFQYFFVYICPPPGIKENKAAFLGDLNTSCALEWLVKNEKKITR